MGVNNNIIITPKFNHCMRILTMHKKIAIVTLILSSFITLAQGKLKHSTKSNPSQNIADFTKNMQYHNGFVGFYWDESTGKIYLKIDKFEQDLLYTYYLQSGVGSNDIGLDRGQIGGYSLVQFKRFGNKIMMIEPNQSYRAYSENNAERQAVTDGFAQSVLWGGKVLASDNHSVLVDLTDFLLRDSQGIAKRLKQMNEGQFSIDTNRSAIYMQNSKNFPENTEFESLITLQGNSPGQYVRSISPATNIISLRAHHSFAKLPDIPYKTRQFDPRSGSIPMSFKDYATPLGTDIQKQWVTRHRLEKKDPTKKISDPVKPIIYYLDPGTPEPIQSALLDGAKWWSTAFESLGYSNAYRVELLPEGADPLDIRYNTIQWVHRSTRGWSYGASIVDPRSGEILKGHVTLGSLRVRQDILIAQGLLSPYDGRQKNDKAEIKIQKMALDRLRQLAAHEVGHTLGLAHNFFSSSNDRASVMDYPHPLVKLTSNGELDITDAYATGIGSWDKISMAYLYKDFTGQDEQQSLSLLLNQASNAGHVFISDRDARLSGGSHPYAHLWDNGSDAVTALLDVLKVRSKAISKFGLDTIKNGEPLAKLEHYLVPIYLFHRYQTEATVKLIAGVNYRYAFKGETATKAIIVDAKTQLSALAAVFKTINAETLALPKRLLPYLLPPVEGSYRGRENFNHRTGLNFDALGITETAAMHTLTLLLNPERVNRLVEHHVRDNQYPSLTFILDNLWINTWETEFNDNYLQAVQHSVNWVVLQQIMNLATDQNLSPLAQSQVLAFLSSQPKKLSRLKNHKVFNQMAVAQIKRFLKNPETKEKKPPQAIPPGSPIGME